MILRDGTVTEVVSVWVPKAGRQYDVIELLLDDLLRMQAAAQGLGPWVDTWLLGFKIQVDQTSLTSAAMPKPYEHRFITPCTCSLTSLEAAAQYCGPAFVYELYVHPSRSVETRSMLRGFASTVKGPLAPYINLHLTAADSNPTEWWFSANGKSMGTEGC